MPQSKPSPGRSKKKAPTSKAANNKKGSQNSATEQGAGKIALSTPSTPHPKPHHPPAHHHAGTHQNHHGKTDKKGNDESCPEKKSAIVCPKTPQITNDDHSVGHSNPQTSSSKNSGNYNNRVQALERQVHYLEQARDITREFVTTTDMQKLMSVIFEMVLKEVEAEAGSLWMVDWKTKENVCRVAEGPSVESILGLRLPEGKGVVGDVIKNGDAVMLADVAEDQRFSRQADDKTGFVTRSMICVPLVIAPHTYGAIQVLNKKGRDNHNFDQNDLNLIEDLALSASIAIKNVRLLQSESKVKELRGLLDISQHITKMLDLNHVLAAVVNMANELVDFETGVLALLNGKSQSLFIAELSGDTEVDASDPQQIKLLELLEVVRKADRSVYIEDVIEYEKKLKFEQNDWVDYLKENELKAAWFIPLSDDEGNLGVLGFVSKTSGFANGSKADILNILANQATVSIRNASLYSKIPFANVLSSMGEKGQNFAKGWVRWALVSGLAITIVAGLHYIPAFRSYSGNCTVEASLGRGVFLSVEGVVSQVHVAEGEVVSEGQTLITLDKSQLELTLTELESELATVDRNIIENRANNEAAEVRKLSIEKSTLLAKIEKAKKDVAATVITSPMDGRILSPRPFELEGRKLSVGDEALRMADLEKPALVVDISEDAVLDLKVGQDVVAILKSQPNHKLRGKLSYIGRTYHVPTEAVDQEAQEETPKSDFIAEVELEQSEVEVLPGMTGTAKIITPESSPITRFWRRIKNYVIFWFGV